MTLLEILSLIAGVFAVALFLLCFQLKKRNQIITCNILSRILYVVQYCLVGAFVGAIMDIAAIPSATCASEKENKFIKKYRVPIFIVVNALIVGTGLFSIFVLEGGNLLGLLAIVGVLFETVALWFNSEKLIRIISFFGEPLWCAYNFIFKAYASSVGNVLAMISIIVALIRYRKAKKEQNVNN